MSLGTYAAFPGRLLALSCRRPPRLSADRLNVSWRPAIFLVHTIQWSRSQRTAQQYGRRRFIPIFESSKKVDLNDNDDREKCSGSSHAAQQSKSFVERLAALPVRKDGIDMSVLEPHSDMHPCPSETRRSARKRHRVQYALDMQRRRREAQGKTPIVPDWRQILHTLTKYTPPAPIDLHKAKIKILVPAASAESLTRDEHLLAIEALTGCRMTLHDVSDPPGALHIIMRGFPKQLNQALRQILALTRHITVLRIEGTKETSLYNGESDSAWPPPHDLVNTSIQPPRPKLAWKYYTRDRDVEEIPQPTHWTQTRVLEYVAALVYSRPSAELAASQRRRGIAHPQAVVDQLLSLFRNPEAMGSLSYQALEMALAYMARQGGIFGRESRLLARRAKRHGMKLDANVYNAIACSAVRPTSLQVFSTVVLNMVHDKIAPTFFTWLVFLRLIRSEAVKRYIIHVMHNKGLLATRSAIRALAEEMVPYDIERSLRLGYSFDGFLADQSYLYDHDWFSTIAANKVIEVLGRHSRFDDAFQVVEHMVHHPTALPDVVTLNTLLTHAQLHTSLRMAVSSLARLRSELVMGRIIPDKITVHLLFGLALRKRGPHLLSVVWRYACLSGTTHDYMCRSVSRLLFHSSLQYHASVKGPTLLNPLLPRRHFTSPTVFICATKVFLGDADGNNIADALEWKQENSGSMILNNQLSAAEHNTWEAAEHGKAGQKVQVSGTLRHMLAWYREKYCDEEPDVDLYALVAEATEMDRQVHRQMREGHIPVFQPAKLDRRKKTMSLEPPHYSDDWVDERA